MIRRLLALLPVCAVMALAEYDWQVGLRHYAAEDFGRAQASFERALSQDPGNSDYNLWVGLAIGRRVQTMSVFRRLGAMSLVKRIKSHFERAVELDGSNLDALDALLGYLLQAPGIAGGSKSRARTIANQIREVDQAHGAQALATCHEDAGELDRAAECYALARALAPHDTGYLVAHAGFLSRCGKHAESDALFDEAFARDSDNPSLWASAARAWIRGKRESLYPRARELAERYLASPDRQPNAAPPFEIRDLLGQL